MAAYAARGTAGTHAPSLLWFRNIGGMRIEPHPLPTMPRDQIALAAGDFGGAGRPLLVSGGFSLATAYDGSGRITLSRR